MDVPVALGPLLVVVLTLLTVISVVVVWRGEIGKGWWLASAAVRAAIQLGLVALLIVAVVRSVWWTALFVLVMFAVAVATSARRIASVRTAWRTAAAIGCGVAPVLGLLLSTGVVPAKPIVLIPIAGILIGGGMTGTSLAGRRALDELWARRGEYEAALALGFMPRLAALEISRPTAGQALVPALDQTRTVGLVTLPGAFVGVMLGGGSPVQAAVIQVLVLVAQLTVQCLAVLVTLELVARGLITRSGPGGR
jgi:putative ABC transport system permease protein